MEIDGVKFINASTCDERYNPVNAPVYFELPVKGGAKNIPKAINPKKLSNNQPMQAQTPPA